MEGGNKGNSNRSTYRRFSRWCIISALILFILYSLFCVGFYFFQELFLLGQNEVPTGAPSKVPALKPASDEMIEVPWGSINFQRFQAEKPKGLVFYLHGNRGNVRLCRWEIEPFIRAGFDVCMMDYRGFGKSKGDLNEFALLSDAQLVYERIRQTYDEDAIVVWGRSFGSGIAAYVASVNCPRGLVLESPYYSIPDCVAHRYPYVPSFLLRYRLRTCDCLGRVRCPVYLVHGTADEKIYFGSSLKLRKLMDARGKTNHLESVPDGTHNLRERPEFHVEAILSRTFSLSTLECDATVQPPDYLVATRQLSQSAFLIFVQTFWRVAAFIVGYYSRETRRSGSCGVVTVHRAGTDFGRHAPNVRSQGRVWDSTMSTRV